MTKRIFDAIPLTPVHVGTGEPITPEEYFDDGDYLVRFNPHTVIAQFSEQERRDFEGHIDRNAMKDAQGVLRSRARRSTESHLYRIRMGESSAGYLRQVTGNPDRRGEVRPLFWNLGRKCAVIPGSAVKGAIRTAVLNSCVASLNPAELQKWERRVESAQTRELGRVARDLEQEMFAVPPGKMESDPFRFLSVSDAEILPEQVRVDKVAVHKRSERALDQQGIEMHAERLMSEADGGGAKPFRVAVGLEEVRIHHPRVEELVTRPLEWEFVRLSCNSFFHKRMAEEEHHFDTLYAGLKWREWLNIPDGGCLLRVGRYSHFESLSVDKLRRGENRFTHTPIRGMGGSRSSCETAAGRPAPFGWLLLRPAA